MRIGYACIALGLPETEMKSCTLKYANEGRLLSLIGHNLNSLDKMIDYNTQYNISKKHLSSIFEYLFLLIIFVQTII